jgi:ribose transport system substrate-binding protein
VAQLKSSGVYVTVVDRGLTDTSAQDAYVAGDNKAFGKASGEYLAKALTSHGGLGLARMISNSLDQAAASISNKTTSSKLGPAK